MKKDSEITAMEIQRVLREMDACRERFNNIITRSADGTIIVDQEGKVRYANPAAESLFRLFGEDLLGKSFGYPIMAGETAEIDFIPRGGEPGIAEMRIVETEWEGEPAFLATLSDITARKQLEMDLQNALDESEGARDRIDCIIRSIAEGLIVTDADHRVILMNAAAEKLLGVFCQEVRGLPIEQLFVGDRIRGDFMAVLQGGEKVDLELPGRNSQPERIIQLRKSTILDRKGCPSGFVTILQDVSREREIERMKTEFVSIAAHELRSPLTSIIGFTELVLATPDGDAEDQKRYLETIKRQAMVLAEIINTLLDISLIESGQAIPLKRETTTASDIVGEADPLIRMNSARFHFEVNLEEDSSLLWVDRKKISQVMDNLLSNAVKYSPEGGVIRICGGPVGHDYLFAVADEGIGMTEEQVERIFDKFYRADHSNTAVGGIGLGMNIARNIVETHGGKIWVESTYGRGTTIRFTLPLLMKKTP
jgi:PAS domain S-box-containing protein